MEGLLDANELRALQAPIKKQFRDTPSDAKMVVRAEGGLNDEGLVCAVATGRGQVDAGLHPIAGGVAGFACSGDMMLEALVACAGVTLRTVATALGIEIRGGRIIAEGDVDARGALGMAEDVPVGFSDIRLSFELDTAAEEEQKAKLIELTLRYCTIYQTLRSPPPITVEQQIAAG
jgi:uncharacterized OsmC-like protein